MRRYLLLLSLIIIFCIISCNVKPTRTEFICIADVDRNSQCKIIPCSEVSKVCKTGKYRIMKNYITGYAYVYSTDPLTDLKKCQEAVK